MKRLLVGGAVLALGITGTGLAQAEAPSGFKVTGGGQIIAEQASGPGDTLAFQAQQVEGEAPDAARGQLQYNGRTDDAPQKFHGIIECLQVEGNFVRLAGTKKTETGETGFFRLILNDVDNNGPQNGTEMLLFNPDANDVNCDEVDDEEYEDQLGRGNVQVHEPKAADEDA